MKSKFIIIGTIFLIITIIIALVYMDAIKKQEFNNENRNTKTEERKTIFEISDVTSKSNEEITIDIKMLEDSEFVAGNFELLYDGNKMEYVQHKKGEIIESGAMSIVNNDKKNNKVLIAYVGNPQNETSLVKKGTFISITFKMKSSINNEKILPEFKVTTLKNKDGQDLKSIINQGMIRIID